MKDSREIRSRVGHTSLFLFAESFRWSEYRGLEPEPVSGNCESGNRECRESICRFGVTTGEIRNKLDGSTPSVVFSSESDGQLGGWRREEERWGVLF